MCIRDSIKGDEIANKPVVNPVSALQGKIAGVQVINSGKAGSDPAIFPCSADTGLTTGLLAISSPLMLVMEPVRCV